jgi:outer membrane protein assembly factor BamE (lipoprotein component of BamABCDE complex)
MVKDSHLLRCRLPVALLLGFLLLGGCSFFQATPQVRGNKIDPEALKELVPGTSTKADVTSLIGSPTATATFDDNTWLYISELTRPRVGQVLGVLEQNVVVVTFTGQGVLQGVQRVGKDDSIPVTVVARTTPSPGTEATFLQQLFGNIGRFNAIGQSQTQTGPAGGAPTPAY